MSSLKEIKNRIGSVRSTLKITSAMKMVASAKLHKAQMAIEGMLPYEQTLGRILTRVLSVPGVSASLDAAGGAAGMLLICFSSNSSLCGGFNANVIKKVRSRIAELQSQGVKVSVLPVGKKIAEALRKDGFECPEDLSELVGKPSAESASALAERIVEAFSKGEWAGVELIYNHFVSTATQVPEVQSYLPFGMESTSDKQVEDDFILEPSPSEILESLLPRVLSLKIYTVILDSTAAEHAARTVAMQTATDNGNEILDELTLEYNKSRQQKITSEILDLIGGSFQ